MTQPIRYVQIWSGWLRATHWLIACGVVFELLSAWARAQESTDPAFWHDWHSMIGQLVALAVLLRSVLLFLPGSSHWRSLLPKRGQWTAIRQTLLFYLSLARAPLPAWYAHNPLWAPLYLLVLLALLGSVASGFAHDLPWQLAGIRPAALHAVLGNGLAGFCVGHVLAAALHDWKGDGALISALFSGKRYFHIQPVQFLQNPMEPGGQSVEVPLNPTRPRTPDPAQQR
jgi:Ni/Fe-hydrogenase 1 B-type cytochrome subunit